MKEMRDRKAADKAKAEQREQAVARSLGIIVPPTIKETTEEQRQAVHDAFAAGMAAQSFATLLAVHACPTCGSEIHPVDGAELVEYVENSHGMRPFYDWLRRRELHGSWEALRRGLVAFERT